MGSRLVMLLAETPVHVGGSESLGAVDLPIQREAGTGLPVIWGQSLKGALREAARDASWTLEQEKATFGSRPPGYVGSDGVADDGDGEGTLAKGKVSVGDAQLVLFPAPALRQAFAWVTSPMLLARLARKCALLGVPDTGVLTVRLADGAACGTSAWQGDQVLGSMRCSVSEDTASTALGAALAGWVCPDSGAFAFTRNKLATDVLTVSDGILKELTETGTDIMARVQLEAGTKAVKHGPFYSENLPAETVLAAYLDGPDQELNLLTELLDGRPLRVGGDETLGKGIVWCRVHHVDSLAGMAAATEAET